MNEATAMKVLLAAFESVCANTYEREGYDSAEAMMEDYLKAAQIAALA